VNTPKNKPNQTKQAGLSKQNSINTMNLRDLSTVVNCKVDKKTRKKKGISIIIFEKI